MEFLASADAAARGFGDVLVAGLLHGTILALLTALLCATLLRRARPALKVALWALVLVKFVAPVGPELPVSLSGAIDSIIGNDAPAAQAEVTAETAARAVGSAPDSTTPITGWLVFRLFLVALYLGLVAWLAVSRFRRFRVQLRLVRTLPVADSELLSAVHAVAFSLNVRRVPRVVLTEDQCGPYLLGVVRPVLVIPRWLASAPAELEAALVHELAHVMRRDAWLRSLQLVVGTVFFFWLPIRLVNRRLDAAREMACDHWVVNRGGIGPRDYARFLVQAAKRSRYGCPGAMALIKHRHQLTERVESLMAAERHRLTRTLTRGPRLGLVSGTAIGAWALLSLGGSARAGSSPMSPRAACVIDDGLVEQIIVSYPEADLDGDGSLSVDEFCAHQERMKRRVVDEAFAGMSSKLALGFAVSVDPRADADGDGLLSVAELERVKERAVTAEGIERLGLAPAQICRETRARDICGDAGSVAGLVSYPNK